MARGGGVRVTGLNQVVRDLLALGLQVDDLKDAFSDIAQQGARLAASYAPKLTGRLAGDVRGNRARSKAVITAGRTSVPYAGPINYGWAAHGIQGSAYLQRADKALAPYAPRRLEDEVNKQIRRRGLG